MGAGSGSMIFEAMVLDGIIWQVNAPGEGRRPEALGLSSGAPPTVRNWRDEDLPQKRFRRFSG